MILSFKQNISAVILRALALSATVFLLNGCGGAAPTTTATTTTTTSSSSAAKISLTTTGTSVKSDGTNSVTITATALTAGNSILAGDALTLSATTGQISASTAVTGTTGTATFTFTAGNSGLNGTATITVTDSSNVTASIPIQITGSTLTLSAANSTQSTGTPVSITITAKDAGGNLMAGQSLSYSIAATSLGSGTLSAATGTTSSLGSATVSLTGTAAGTVDVLVQWLNSTGTVTASATKTITITAAGNSFQVTTPASSPFAVTIGTTQNVVVNVPTTINTVSVSKVRYSTTIGTWNATNSAVLTVTPSGSTDIESFHPGSNAGNATVQVDALDVSNNVLSTATVIFSITAAANTAANITLQSNATVIAPSAGTTQSTATLDAFVTDASNNPVGGAAVLFQLIKTTGTGESVTPVVVTTNTGGVAGFPAGHVQATYTAGTSTTQNNQVRASLVATPAASAVLGITVGGTAGSVSLNPSIAVTSDASNTYYTLPVTVFVTDSTGAAVNGAVVTLKLWPAYYLKGIRNTATGLVCLPLYSGGLFPNEDVNKNLVLDVGEDVDGPGGYANGGSGPYGAWYGAPDGALWPAPAQAGSIPTSVTTNSSGLATFNWTYGKLYADWIKANITATTQVNGTESTASLPIYLRPASADITSPCHLYDSPFN